MLACSEVLVVSPWRVRMARLLQPGSANFTFCLLPSSERTLSPRPSTWPLHFCTSYGTHVH